MEKPPTVACEQSTQPSTTPSPTQPAKQRCRKPDQSPQSRPCSARCQRPGFILRPPPSRYAAPGRDRAGDRPTPCPGGKVAPRLAETPAATYPEGMSNAEPVAINSNSPAPFHPTTTNSVRDASVPQAVVVMPANQAIRVVPSPRSGHVAPIEHRFQAGVSPNPEGRPPGGLVVEEWLNLLLHDAEMDRDQLWRIAEAAKTPTAKAIAANQALLARFPADLSDFEPYIEGESTLKQLKQAGVATYGVKSCEVKRKRLIVGAGDAAQEWEVEHRKIELHDRSGPAFDRVMDRTQGGVTQRSKAEVAVVHLNAGDLLASVRGDLASFRRQAAPPARWSDADLLAEVERRGLSATVRPMGTAGRADMPTNQGESAQSAAPADQHDAAPAARDQPADAQRVGGVAIGGFGTPAPAAVKASPPTSVLVSTPSPASSCDAVDPVPVPVVIEQPIAVPPESGVPASQGVGVEMSGEVGSPLGVSVCEVAYRKCVDFEGKMRLRKPKMGDFPGAKERTGDSWRWFIRACKAVWAERARRLGLK